MRALFPPPGVRVLTVEELTGCVKETLEEVFCGVWVEGEISNFKRYASGHWYFSLKDAKATLAAIVFRGVNLRLRYELHDGLKVVAYGRLEVYAPRGQYSLIIEQIQPRGIGELELAYRQTREKLFSLGFFDAGRKKPLPAVPRRVALVTSAAGSAVRDMLETLGRRWPLAEVWVRAVRVQGDGAREEIAAAIGLLNHIGGARGATPIDVILLARGGGSLEDLWPFNEEVVARAIYQSSIPIITGIGHEDDYTIADMVADLRALTPTDAAAKAVPDRAEKLAGLAELDGRLRGAVARRLERSRRQTAELVSRRCFRAPLARVREGERRADELQERLGRALRQRVEQARRQVEAAGARLGSVSPLNVLARGYSLTLREADESIVRGVDQVVAGERLVSVVANGRIVSTVAAAVKER